MSHIVVYTLKHNEIPDVFNDYWMTFEDIETAEKSYDMLIKTDGAKQGWHVFTIALTSVIKSTDY